MPHPLQHRLRARAGVLYRSYARKRTVVTSPAVMQAVRRVVQRKRYCLLVTHGHDGVHARVVQPFPPDESFTVWLGASPASRKVRELQERPQASLVYEDDRAQACVVLEGVVHVVDDLAILRRRFMPMWRAFFPEGPDQGFVALRFETERMEVIDFSRHVTPEPFGLRAATVVRGPDATWVLLGHRS